MEEPPSEGSTISVSDASDSLQSHKGGSAGRLRRSFVAARFAIIGEKAEPDLHKYDRSADHDTEEEDHLFVRKSTRELIIPVASMGDMVA